MVKVVGGGEKIEYTTEVAKRGNLIQTVTATGAVASAEEIDLNFKTPGKLARLAVKEGDKVKAKQFLAGLNAAGLSAQVAQYQANVAAAQADLEKIKAGSSAEEIQVYEEKFIKAKNDLNTLTGKRDNELPTLREKALNELNNAIFTIAVALNTVYNYLINDNTTNDLQVTDTTALNQLEIDYSAVLEKFNEAKIKVDLAKADRSNETIISAAESIAAVLSALNSFLDDSFKIADSIIVNSTYTQTKKDTIKSDITTEQSNSNTSITSLQTAKSNLINSINSYASLVQAAENTLTIAEAELNLTKAEPRSFEISAAQAKVDQAQAQLDQALADLSEYSLIAPIDGIITEVNFSLGEQTSVTTPALKMISLEKFEIKVDIPESDIAKLTVGDKAVIELDAFSSDHLFSGQVAFIDPAQTVVQDVIYYKTTVSLEANDWTDKIKSGMSADVTITTDRQDDVIYIPQRAVKIREASLGEVPQKYVEVLVSNKVEEKIVTIGLRGDNGLVEIVSGLNEGDQVITFKKTNGKK